MRPAILSTERIGEVGMVEDVEKFRPKLRTKPLAELPIFRQ